MTERILLFGAGGHACAIADALEVRGEPPIGLIDDDPVLRGSARHGYPVLGGRDALRAMDRDETAVIIAIAFNDVRRRLAGEIQALGLRLRGVRHPAAIISPRARVSDTAQILAGAIVNPGATIGDHAVINTGAIVEHDAEIGPFVHVGPGARLAGRVRVGEGAFIGIGASVIPFRRIGAWALIGAGAAVTEDVPDGARAGGVPARPLPESSASGSAGGGPAAIPLARPSIGDEEERAVRAALRSGWISQGPRVEAFEEKLAAYLGVRHVRAVNAGTSAILLALKAIGIGRGDSVIAPAFTCAATAMPALALGAEVIFADVDPASFCMSWEEAAAAIRPSTRAVILVHPFGAHADARGFAERCRDRGILLIEDACLSLGARQDGTRVGTFGIAGCFSFHPRKMLTTGEGGAVATNDDAIAEAVARDRSYGAARSAWDRHRENLGRLEGFDRVAFNFKLTDLQAALGSVQIDRLDGFIERRRRIAALYHDLLGDLRAISLPPLPADPEDHVWQAFVCTWSPEGEGAEGIERAIASRARFVREVSARGIAISDAAQFLPALPVCGADPDARMRFPGAFQAAGLSFALPIFPDLTDEDVRRVADAVRAAAREASR